MKRRRKDVNLKGSRDDAKTKEGDDYQSKSAIPIQNLIDILSRLPFKTIFNCMCVCKKWKDLISDPEFGKLHHSRAPGSLILRSHRHGRRRSPRSLCLLDLEASDICSPDAVVKFSPDFGLPIGNFEVVNTCNGLICIRRFQSPNHISILNPLLGDYITLPLTKKKHKSYLFSWFGHSPKTDEYKVIQFVHQPLKLEVEIHRGCLNWIVDDPSKQEFIFGLDIGRELFQLVPAPPHLGPDDKDRTEDMMLGVLGGCLYFFEYPLGDHFDIWVMKQYGVQESWTKEFIIKNPSTDIIWYWNLYRPISLLINGEILMSHKSKAMVSYNPEDRSFRFLKIHGIQNFEANPYVPSFLSLRDIVKGENISVSNIHSGQGYISKKNITVFELTKDPLIH
ncbi:unnamed protein product [Dovyalis caffra]|uniref:F-box domain-containing protein n=1 Tax=Dovyalis caffra TaxID=77055 RepID=A0AAV1SQT9_9ROSI|nr:unnamed protein product [Dovyalis caffra]